MKTEMNTTLIENAQIIDPSLNVNATQTVSIENGSLKFSESSKADNKIDGSGKILIPALIDLQAGIKNIQADSQAAKQAGIGYVCMTPNTSPVIDTPADVTLIEEKNNAVDGCKILPLGALTQGLKGEQLANMYSLQQAGCIALTNSKKPVKDLLVLRRLMEYAATHDILILINAQEETLAKGGLMHEGETATRLGLVGIPESAETIAVAQTLLLAEETNARLHFSQISCARSIDMIRKAKEKGLKISADVAIANLMFTDEHVTGYNSLFNLQPPLRSEKDRQALLAAVNNREIAICSNHMPSQAAAKTDTFAAAATGMNTLTSWFSLGLNLVDRGELTLENLVYASSTLPAEILRLPETSYQLKENTKPVMALMDLKDATQGLSSAITFNV